MYLFPPAWITDRVAMEDDQVGHVKIFKGEIIGIYIYGVHHSTALWDDPERFDPERFSVENKKSIAAYSYFPFGGGPRLCIGQQFAWTEMILAIYHLVKEFEFKLVEGHRVEAEPLITLRPKYGMWMGVGRREWLTIT